MKHALDFNPTRREVVLLTALLCFLLFVTRNGQQPIQPVTTRYLDAVAKSLRDKTTHERNSVPEPRLSWTGARIPETKLVAYTPGKYMLW